MVRICVFISIILMTSPLLEVFADEETCSCIKWTITEDVLKCPDRDGPMKMNLKLKLESSNDTNQPDMAKLNGNIVAEKEVTSASEIRIAAYLITENGLEPVFQCVNDLCSCMKDEDAPWYPVLQYFGTTKCPIEAKTYPVADLMMDLGWADDFITAEFCGQYMIEISIFKGLDTVMCSLLGTEIAEVDMPCDQCKKKVEKRK